jgi:hypothetical protein
MKSTRKLLGRQSRWLLIPLCAIAIMAALTFALTACDDGRGDNGGGGGGNGEGGSIPSALVGKWYLKASPDTLAFEITSAGKITLNSANNNTFDLTVSGNACELKSNGNSLGTFNYSINNGEMTITNGTGIGMSVAALSPVVKGSSGNPNINSSPLVGSWYNADQLAFEITSANKFIMSGTTYDISVSGSTATLKLNGATVGTFSYAINNGEMTITNGTGIGMSVAALSPLEKGDNEGEQPTEPGGQKVPPTINTTSLQNGTVGTWYSQRLTATGSAPITWSVIDGILPTDLYLSENGTISGTPATAGTFEFTVEANNAAGYDTHTFYITITDSNSINQFPIADDFNINGTGTFPYDGSAKVVDVTPKPGKSTGEITVKYNDSTTAPSAVGSYTITFDVAEATGFYAAYDLFAGMLDINKSAGATVNAPVLNTKTHNSITINSITSINGQQVEYIISTSYAVPLYGEWQTGTTFNDLNAGTTYYIFARTKENEIYETGEASGSLTVTTLQTISPDRIEYYWIDQHGSLVTTNGGVVRILPGETLLFSAQGEGYNVSQWYVNGIETNQSENTYTLSGATLGNHTVSLVVEKNGKFYNTNITITVMTGVTVTFNVNGGTGTVPASQTVAPGASITLPDGNGLSRPNYNFGGWNTNTYGTGTNYNAGDSYLVTSNITLYARWVTDVTVTYNINGGYGTTPPAQKVAPDTPITLPSESGFSKTGCTFGGWNTDVSGTGANYNAGGSFTPTGDITLYARWNVARNGSGTEADPYVLISGFLYNDSITSNVAGSAVWYSFSIERNTPYYIWLNDSRYGDGTKTLEVWCNHYLNNGNSAISGFSAHWSVPLVETYNESGTVKIKVTPLTNGNTGTFAIGYNTFGMRPTTNGTGSSGTAVIPTPLTADSWINGSISNNSSIPVRYSINVRAFTNYRIWWNDRNQGNSTKNLDVRVDAYFDNRAYGQEIFTAEDSAWATSKTITPTQDGTVILCVYPKNPGDTGTFAIVYSGYQYRPEE